jgi:hypothetical protein
MLFPRPEGMSLTGERRERVTRLRGTKVTEALREPALSPGEAAHGGYPRVHHGRAGRGSVRPIGGPHG